MKKTTFSVLCIVAICIMTVAASAADVKISTSITVNGTTYNGNGNRIIGVGMGDGSQTESQKPLFKVTNGTVSNVRIGAPGCDGIWMYGKATLSSVTWEDVGEDAATAKSGPGPFLITGGSSVSAADKDFMVNAVNATWTLQSHAATNVLKVVRQVGGHTDKCTMTVKNCNLKTVREAVIRTDSTTTVASITGCTLTNVKCLIMRP